MRTVEVLVQHALDPASSHAIDLQLLGRAADRPRRMTLRAYQLAGEGLSLGRYHLAPVGDPGRRVGLHRRLGGGRVLPFGPGVATLSLTLPHRSGLVSDDPLALRPEQALNRCVRALLGGLRRLGVDAFYAGRDRVTVNQRMLGLVSLETDQDGATVFEAVLATGDCWARFADLATAVDPAGVVAAEIPAPAQVASLADLGPRPALEDLATGVAGALAQEFGLTVTAGSAPTVPPQAAVDAATWVASRRLRPGLDRHAVEWGQLGVFEVYLAAPAGTIDDLLFAGDFLADSPSIARLEARLRGCRRDRAAVAAVVDAVYADPRSFLLGVGPLQTVVDTIVRAA